MLRDLLYAGRALRSTPGSTGAALLAFALGIGATTAVFSVVEGILLRSLPYPQAARLVDIKSSSGTSPFETYEAWRSARDVLDDAAAAVAEQPVLQVERGPERVSAWIVTENFFPLLGATPQFGNGFPRDDRMTAPLAMLSHDFWQSHFGGDPRILDRSLTLDGVNYAIAGVLPAGFLNPVGFRHVRDPDVWLGLGAFRTRADAAEWLARPGFWVIGRLRTGVTPGQAAASLGALNGGTREQQPLVTRLHDSLVGGVRVALLLTVGAVGLVMLVACANVATLLVSRGIARERDMWVRAALGATRARLLRVGLIEAVLLGLAGGVLGLLVAMAALPVLLRLASSELPDIAPIGLNWRVLVGATGISMIAGLLAGIVPAWRAARGAGLAGMRTVSPIASARASRYGTSDVFIVAQVAITLILLAGAGVLARSFIRLQHVDPGFDPEGLLVVDLQLPTDRYRTAKAIGTYAQLVTEAVGAVPGVISVAVGTGRPLEGYAVGDVQTGDAQPSPGTPLAWISAVTPEYFAALGVPVRRGSLFGADPSSGVVIDEAAARAYFPNEDDPLGRPLTFYGNRTRTVLGVVGDTREMNLHDTPPPHVYQALADDAAPGLKVLVRTAQARAHAAPIVRRVVQGIDGTVPIDRVVAMRELMSDSVGRQRYYAWLLAAFAIVALLLAASGLFGIVAYAVTQRTKEIGIRMALGADSRAVLRLIMARGIALAGAGLLIGLGVALATTQLLRSFLFEIGPRDPVALAAVALLLLVTVVAACYAPARRATAIDPLLAIRSE